MLQQRGRGEVQRDNAQPVRALDVLAFLAEVALLLALAVVGAHQGNGMSALALAVLIPAGVMLPWAFLLAPRATYRLRYPLRLFAKLAIVLLAAAVLVMEGDAWCGMALLVLAGSAITLGEVCR